MFYKDFLFFQKNKDFLLIESSKRLLVAFILSLSQYRNDDFVRFVCLVHQQSWAKYQLFLDFVLQVRCFNLCFLWVIIIETHFHHKCSCTIASKRNSLGLRELWLKALRALEKLAFTDIPQSHKFDDLIAEINPTLLTQLYFAHNVVVTYVFPTIVFFIVCIMHSFLMIKLIFSIACLKICHLESNINYCQWKLRQQN